MAAYLITHSLLSSWLHLIRENPYEDLTTEGDPLAEFMLVLKREPTPRTEAMQNGIDFENLVTAIVNGHDDPNNPWSWAAGQIATIINGGRILSASCSSKPAGRFRCGAWMWFCMAASMP